MDSDWSNLPKHILESVLEKLESSMDYLRFGGVCVSWNDIMRNNQMKRNKMLRHHHVPMLFIPSEEEECTWILYDITNNKCLESKLEVPYNRRFCGSSEGWLIAANINYSLSLYKPFTFVKGGENNEKISVQLPCLLPYYVEYVPQVYPEGFLDDSDNNSEDDDYLVDEEERNFDFDIFKAIITADPLENSDDCIVAALYGERNELAFIRPGKDTSWITIDARCSFQDILYYDNQLYAVDYDGRLVSIQFKDMKYVTGKSSRTSYFFGRRYLVKSYHGDLLLVERYIDFSYDKINGHQRATKEFKIFKLDFEEQEWVEVRSIGDTALFLGENSSISILASNFVGCQPNCIYFTRDDDLIIHHPKGLLDSGIYNVETRIVSFHFSMDSTIFAKMSKRPPIWVVPTLNNLY